MRQYAAIIIAAVVALLAGCVGTAWAATGTERDGSVNWVPPDDTIVDIEGDAANGFTIRHYDGSSLFPPTDSEARAECAEHASRLDRVRCRVEVRTWYRDLAATQVALRWAHASG